ncbi:hypothetical protein Hamer_G023734 [Homarus americanus]|uniref:Uncharacterized protein n=1 Tax=Homarus americanus TaxID=6706 RepID=A0A8J5JTJ5_HOMAM|nr:hypothetical protein Hamer_G023734 [Homarus americanus]
MFQESLSRYGAYILEVTEGVWVEAARLSGKKNWVEGVWRIYEGVEVVAWSATRLSVLVNYGTPAQPLAPSLATSPGLSTSPQPDH